MTIRRTFFAAVAALALLLALPAFAALTGPQRATLLTAVKNDATANGYRLAGDTFSLKAWCNGAGSTAAWRTAVQPQESDEAATYTAFDTVVAGKRDSWRIFLMFPRDYTRAKVRNWVVDVWGTATSGSTTEGVLQAATELATRAQAALGGVTRTTGTVSALDRTFNGQVDEADVNFLVNAT